MRDMAVPWHKLMLTTVMGLACVRSAFVHRLDQCEPIKIPLCRAMPYNMTSMPNLLHHNTQENAKLAFEQFEVLIDQNCSEVLLFFLCSIYVPICTVSFQPEPIPPCKGVCERARAGCEPLMNAHNVSWPQALDCASLPRYDRGVCISPEAIVTPVATKGCKCKKRTRPSLRNYRRNKYDFAIRARVRRKKKVGVGSYVMRMEVLTLLRSGRVAVPPSGDLDLWINSSCACPQLRRGREYLIMGHEDVASGRLMLSPVSIATRWKSKWIKRLQKWDRKLSKKGSSSRRRNNKRKNRRKKKSKKKKRPRHQRQMRERTGTKRRQRFPIAFSRPRRMEEKITLW